MGTEIISIVAAVIGVLASVITTAKINSIVKLLMNIMANTIADEIGVVAEKISISIRNRILVTLNNATEEELSKLCIEKDKKIQRLSAVGLFLKRRQTADIRAFVVFTLSFSVLIVFNSVTGISQVAGSVFIFSLMLMTITRSWLLMYRVKKGWFGMNTYEARELVRLIIDHHGSGGDGPHDFYKEEDLEQLKEQIGAIQRSASSRVVSWR